MHNEFQYTRLRVKMKHILLLVFPIAFSLTQGYIRPDVTKRDGAGYNRLRNSIARAGLGNGTVRMMGTLQSVQSVQRIHTVVLYRLSHLKVRRASSH